MIAPASTTTAVVRLTCNVESRLQANLSGVHVVHFMIDAGGTSYGYFNIFEVYSFGASNKKPLLQICSYTVLPSFVTA